VNDRVWAAGYFSFPLALDRSDGTDHQADLKHWFLRSQWIPAALLLYQRGRDLVRIDDRMLLAGGGDLLENHHVRQGKPGRTHYRLFYCNAEGDWVVDPGPRKISISYTTPACDDELLVCTGPAHQTGPRSDTTGLYAWPLADFRKAAEAMQKEPCAREDKNGQLRLNQNAFSQFEHGGAPWKKPELQVNAFVLTKDAVLAAHGMLEEHKQLPRKGRTLEDARSPRARFKGWKVTAFSRDGKETLWEVDLPQEPLFNGIAVARDGSVLVTLRDGSTVCVRGN